MLNGTCVCFGGRSLCNQVDPVTVRMVHYVSDVKASLGMKRVRRRFDSAFCFDHTGRKRQEEVLKLRVELANFIKVLSCPLHRCVLISRFESSEGRDIPHTRSQQHCLRRSSVSSKSCM